MSVLFFQMRPTDWISGLLKQLCVQQTLFSFLYGDPAASLQLVLIIDHIKKAKQQTMAIIDVYYVGSVLLPVTVSKQEHPYFRERPTSSPSSTETW